jgi:hypothetical protein
MAERTTGGELPRWFPLLFAGMALFNLVDRDWLGAAIWSVVGVGFLLPAWQSGPAWAKVTRVVLGVVFLALFVVFINRLRNEF